MTLKRKRCLYHTFIQATTTVSNGGIVFAPYIYLCISTPHKTIFIQKGSGFHVAIKCSSHLSTNNFPTYVKTDERRGRQIFTTKTAVNVHESAGLFCTNHVHKTFTEDLLEIILVCDLKSVYHTFSGDR